MNSPDVYEKAGEGFNAHAVVRFGDAKQLRVVGRYDQWTPEMKYGSAESEILTKHTNYAGFVWEQNKNVQWVANVIRCDDDIAVNGDLASGAKANGTQYMLTTQLSF